MRRRSATAFGVTLAAAGVLGTLSAPADAKGDFPVAMAVSGESLWIAHSGGRVEQRELDSGRPSGATVRAGVGVRDLEAAAGRVWALTTIAHDGRATWLRPIGPGGGERAIPLPGGAYCTLAASGVGLVAVSCSGRRLVRIDPATRTVPAVSRPPGRVGDVAFTEGRLWLALRQPRVGGRNRGTAVVPVDPLTGRQRGAAIDVGRHGAELAVAGGRLWAASGDGRLTAIDASTGRVEYRAVVGMRPHDLAAEGDEVWIAASRLGRRGTLIAIAGGRRREVSLGRSGDPLQVAVSGGTVWAVGYRFGVEGLEPRIWRVDAARARLVPQRGSTERP